MITMDIIQAIPQVGLQGVGWHEFGWHGIGYHSLGLQYIGISSLLHFKLGFLQIHVADWSLLAQQFDTDPFRGIREWFGNFVATGQVWALITGFILGYLFRGLTSYG